MDRDTIRDYLEKSDFTPMQADALSRLLSQTVTKEDLQLAVADVKSEVRESISSLRSELQESIHRVEVTLSRWMITILLALGGLITLLNYFLD